MSAHGHLANIADMTNVRFPAEPNVRRNSGTVMIEGRLDPIVLIA
jgi:hypothetical protein